MNLLIIILAIVGFSISLYTYITEQKVKENPDYKPFCDISDKISCTKPMQSQYANILNFSNAILGMLFYVLVSFLALFNFVNLLLLAAIGGFITTCVLAYLLFFKIKSLCILCTSLYIINLTILALVIYQIYF